MMRMLQTKILLAAALATFAAPAFAQASAVQSTTASSRIVQPITLTKNSDLAFGTIVRPTTASSTVTINQTTGARTVTGSDGAAVSASASGRATYTVGGEGAQTFSISVPATVTMINGANNIVVTLTATGATGTLSGTLGTAGTATFGVGGSFTLPSTQVTGNYTASFNATVAYN